MDEQGVRVADDEPTGREEWRPDVLPGFEQRTLPLAPDDEGDVVATIVRRRRGDDRPGGRADVPARDAGVDLVYVHGWSDYFFQTALADFWEGIGVRFHALDLRKYGRSLRPHQTPGFVTDLTVYDEDLEAALGLLGHGPEGHPSRRLLLMGHSTGGLTLSLWTGRHPGRAAGLVLNSPWLEFQTREAGRRLLEPMISAQAALAPTRRLVNVDLGFYTRAVSADFDGEWAYDLAWRPVNGFRTTPAWLHAIFRAQDAVAHGLGITVPVLVLLSARSTLATRWSEDMLHTDTAIDVVGVARRATDLGTTCTIVRLEGALHDVVLSAPPVREAAWDAVRTWFDGYVFTGWADEPAGAGEDAGRPGSPDDDARPGLGARLGRWAGQLRARVRRSSSRAESAART